ncbi:MAG: restriction endonuclease subunit S [Proteobacteria bacterium]|nr:restriction endonuclease subunit S [Pseudomonadota bacterium]
MNGNPRRSVKLGDLFTIKHGYAFKGEHFGTEGSHIVLTPGNFFDEGGFKKEGDKEKWYSGKIPEDYILFRGDLLVAMTEQAEGLLGSSAIVPEDGHYLHNQRLGLIQNFNDVDKRFLYYLFNSQTVRQQIRASCSGVKVRHTSPSRIYDVKVDISPLPTQRKIAAILSAYDDLIENNLRRIKILEEMAQNLYREWFVKFRFPGHKHARFTDSPLGPIPEGWEVATLGNHLIALESGKRPKGGAKDLSFGIPSVGAENIFGIGRHKYQSEKYVSREFFEGMRNGVVKDGDVALYKDGAYIGRSAYFRDSFPHAQFCVNEHVFLLRTTRKRLTQNILYLWLQEPATVSAFRATNANAAQPGINQTGVNGLSLIIPPSDIAGRFDELVEPTVALIVSLAKKNEALRRTRNLLLPRLISGEVDVSELDIAVPEVVEA